MNRYVSYHKKLALCSAVIAITCWNGSVVDSTSKDKRPDCNFYGELEDHTSTCDVEDILIGGKYEKITVYKPIQTPNASDMQSPNPDGPTRKISPQGNTIELNLKDIKEIAMVHPTEPIKHEITIEGRKYLEFTMTNQNDTKENFIVESSRELTCVKKDSGANGTILEQRKITMIHVRKLKIDGWKAGYEKNSMKSDSHESTISEKTKIAQGTEQILDQMEKKVKNLSKEDASNYTQLKESLLSMLKALRSQLQKMLNLIKN